jgi:SHS family lactate transporter-like MFS transporter
MDLSSLTPVEFAVEPTARDRWSAFCAGMAGWTLDAFDYFLVVFCLTDIGATFHQSDTVMTEALFATLALRPVGAFLFGAMTDRYGRRPALILNLLLFSVATLATAAAPNFHVFLLIRGGFGIVMGGQWGIGASLAMEKVPVRMRGVLSGLLQQGYSLGNLLAAVATFFFVKSGSWRLIFSLAAIPALIAAGLCYFFVEESDVWKRTKHNSFAGIGKAFYEYKWLFLYMIIFMMSMMMSSHGTQDLYPIFLQRRWHVDTPTRSVLTGITILGAVFGGIVVGFLSDRIGRRRAMVLSLTGAMLTIPLWAFAPSLPLLVLGGFIMQFMVQGAWGVVPAHLAEMAPDSIRGSLPGLGYQCGALLTASAPKIQATLAAHYGYPHALAGTMLVIFCVAITMTLLGKEKMAVEFGKA